MANTTKKEVATKGKSAATYTSSAKTADQGDMLYGKSFYMWMLIGVALIALGMFLMAGGNQAPTEWNTDEIYSFRRTVLAPSVILVGLVVEVYAIFKK